MSGLLSAPHVAAVSTWLTGLAAFVLGIEGTMPHAWQNTAIVIAGLIAKVGIGVKYLDVVKPAAAAPAATISGGWVPPSGG